MIALALLMMFVAAADADASCAQAAGKRCAFPFTYKGQNYSACINIKSIRYWCATTENYDQDKCWAYCDEVCPSCEQTGENCCVFPFVYNGEKYGRCTNVKSSTYWCATTSSYDRDRCWANCTLDTAQEPKAYGGWCIKPNGEDENAGTIRVAASTKDGCLAACKKNQNAKGCEWGDNICIVHTNQVCSGSGKGSHICWVLKSKDCTEWNQWSTWGTCSITCGGGTQSRTRTCSDAAGTCVGNTVETKDCNEGVCPEWSQWSTWGTCSKPCGKGAQSRTRTCSIGICTGNTMETKDCNVDDCPACQWTDQQEGISTEKGEITINGPQTKTECLTACLWKKLEDDSVSAVNFASTTPPSCVCKPTVSYSVVKDQSSHCDLVYGIPWFRDVPFW